MGAMLVRHEPTSASLVRRHISDDLARNGIELESIEEVVLVASELVGNAIRHTPSTGNEPLDVTWDVDDACVTVRVTDSSSDLPQLQAAGPEATSGRGLTIIAAVSDAWGVHPVGGGKRVWASVPVRRAAAMSDVPSSPGARPHS